MAKIKHSYGDVKIGGFITVKVAFSDKGYIHRLDTSDKRWINEEIGVVTDSILEFVSNI